jgi:hypothetical protein
MRAPLSIAAVVASFAFVGAAVAQTPNVSVAVGEELQSKAPRIGVRDIDQLREDLAKTVARALARSGAQRADLVLEMAVPNRPTFEQTRRHPGLSMWSFGVGGASVTGTVTLADGATTPISYRWYETDITRPGRLMSTWYDAERAFGMLSYRIARGDLPNQGPHRPGGPYDGLFGSLRY